MSVYYNIKISTDIAMSSNNEKVDISKLNAAKDDLKKELELV